MTPREKAAVRRQRPRQRDRCIDVIPVSPLPPLCTTADKLHSIARLLRSLAGDCDHTADTLRWPPQANTADKLHSIGCLLRSLANDCDTTADTLQ